MSTESQGEPEPNREFDYNVAMRRLVYLVIIGSAVVVLYGFRCLQGSSTGFLSTVTVGLLAAGAALLVGGLLGFLFGVPHTRDEAGAQKPATNKDASATQPESQGANTASPSYRANTSLEQISDWLTKMLVGVGLVEIKVIPGKLKDLAAYIAKGVGNDETANTFALCVILYFSVCGFVFGFLWARLYLARWFHEADTLEVLGKKITRLEQRQQADARALVLISQLAQDTEDPPLSEGEVAARILAASPSVRSQIFAQTQKTSANKDVENYDERNQAVVSILKGLIKSDKAERYHRNHSELSYALRRQSPPNWKDAEAEISKAIEIRDKRGKTGWKFYEFHRARCLIGQDSNFARRVPSDPPMKARIITDLREAYTDSDKWPRWYTPDSTVFKWMALNEIGPAELQQP